MKYRKDTARRLTEKLHRLAYELESDAPRLRRQGEQYAPEANGLAAIASDLGKIARSMDRTLSGEKP